MELVHAAAQRLSGKAIVWLCPKWLDFPLSLVQKRINIVCGVVEPM
jgi:hypothetical protein